MEEFYRLNTMNMMSSSTGNESNQQVGNGVGTSEGGGASYHHEATPLIPSDSNFNMLHFQTDQNMTELMKNQIASHPRYPDLVSAYIDCQKVGAPPKMKSHLEDVGRLSQHINACRSEIGADPDLDEFMDTYCGILHTYKEELSKPVNEATAFLSNIEQQLGDLCKGTFTKSNWDSQAFGEAIGSSEEDFGYVESEAAECRDASLFRTFDKDIKDMLLHKYSGYLSKLRKDFLKNRKKGKLPKDARSTLMDWWNSHNRWPYPTEEEKMQLSLSTGLDPRQINNWFINQRKRHWKPSEDMRFALLDGVSGSSGGINGEGGAPGYLFDAGFGHDEFM